jgi:hypothetical protein
VLPRQHLLLRLQVRDAQVSERLLETGIQRFRRAAKAALAASRGDSNYFPHAAKAALFVRLLLQENAQSDSSRCCPVLVLTAEQVNNCRPVFSLVAAEQVNRFSLDASHCRTGRHLSKRVHTRGKTTEQARARTAKQRRLQFLAVNAYRFAVLMAAKPPPNKKARECRQKSAENQICEARPGSRALIPGETFGAAVDLSEARFCYRSFQARWRLHAARVQVGANVAKCRCATGEIGAWAA